VAVPAAYAATPPAYVSSAVQSSARPAEDTARDAARHPAELVAFAGIKPGDTVADIMPGGGYFTRIFSGVVGANGHVYAVVPAEFVQKNPKATDKVTVHFKDGRVVHGALIFNPFKGTGRLINIDQEVSVDFAVDDIRDLKF